MGVSSFTKTLKHELCPFYTPPDSHHRVYRPTRSLFIEHAPLSQCRFQDRARTVAIFLYIFFGGYNNIHSDTGPVQVAVYLLCCLAAVDRLAHHNQHVKIAVPVHLPASGRTKQQNTPRLDTRHNSTRDFLQKLFVWYSQSGCSHQNLFGLYNGLSSILPILRPVLLTRTQCAQIVPVVDAVIVTVLPDDGQRVGADRDNVAEARGGRVSQFPIEHIRVRLGAHVLVPAAAGGAGTGGAQ